MYKQLSWYVSVVTQKPIIATNIDILPTVVVARPERLCLGRGNRESLYRNDASPPHRPAA